MAGTKPGDSRCLVSRWAEVHHWLPERFPAAVGWHYLPVPREQQPARDPDSLYHMGPQRPILSVWRRQRGDKGEDHLLVPHSSTPAGLLTSGLDHSGCFSWLGAPKFSERARLMAPRRRQSSRKVASFKLRARSLRLARPSVAGGIAKDVCFLGRHTSLLMRLGRWTLTPKSASHCPSQDAHSGSTGT